MSWVRPLPATAYGVPSVEVPLMVGQVKRSGAVWMREPTEVLLEERGHRWPGAKKEVFDSESNPTVVGVSVEEVVRQVQVFQPSLQVVLRAERRVRPLLNRMAARGEVERFFDCNPRQTLLMRNCLMVMVPGV